MTKRLLGLVIGLLMALFLISPVLAENNPVVVTAAQIRYDDHSEQIEANGNVEMKYKDVTIKANTAILDQNLKMVLALGDVTVSQNGDSFEGDRFIYDMRAEQGWISPVSTQFTDASTRGPAFFSADQGMIHNDNLFLKHSQFTSCDLAEPHYHITSEKVEYYPDDRMIFRKAWYWEGKHRLFYWPYLYISLKKGEEDSNPFEVDAGHNSDVGWFLYVGYRFYLNSRNKGLAYTEITEYGGDGLGFKNTTRLSSKSKWYQDFYFRDNSDNYKAYDEYKLAFGYENTKNSNFTIKTNVENWYKVDTEGSSDSKFDLSLQGISPYPSISLTYDNDNDESEVFNLGESWSYNTKSDVEINTNGSWYFSDYENGDYSNSFRYYFNAAKDWEWSNLALKLSNSRVYNTSSSSNQNYLPEITFNIPKLNLPWIGDLVYNGQYTNYQYLSTSNGAITSEENGERLASDLSKSKTLWENTSLRLYTDSRIRYRYYIVDNNTSDFSGVIEALNLQKTFWQGLSTTMGINYIIANGAAPSMFVSAYSDSLTEGGSLTNSWVWSLKTFNTNLSGGYNFTQSMFNPLYLSFNWNPAKKGSLSFSTVGYLQDDSYYHTGLGVTTFTVGFLPKENWRINLGLNYDFQNESWSERYFESFITQQLTKNWKGRLSARYSDVVGDFSLFNFDLTYDWHCREVIFSYDYVEGTYKVQLNFKAFPQASLSTDMDPMELLYL